MAGLTPPSPTLALLATLAAVSLWLPLGASGLIALAWLAAAALALLLGRLSVRHEGTAWLLCWVGWIALSAAWSPAPWPQMLRQLSHAVALLAIPLVAASLTAAQAQRALRGFVLSALLLALAWCVHALWPFTQGGLLSSMVYYVGNKSIANGTLLALAAALAAHWAWLSEAPRRRAAWAATALALSVVLLWRSPARTPLLVLALCFAAVAWWHLRSLRSRLLTITAVLALATAMVVGGASGLAARSAAGQLDASNQHRRIVYEQTLAMVVEKPLLGHGLASWAWLWPARSPSAELRSFNTAHNLPLELAAESGLPAMLLLLPVLAAWIGVARRGGVRGAGGPVVLVLLAWGGAGLFNAALRDPAFATPLIVLLALALAAASQRRL